MDYGDGVVVVGGERGVCNRESEFLRFAVINCRLLGLACRNIFIH
jgi:hypothetical protein